MENITINQLEFENLSYQDFYEDKILFIEYDLSPTEMLNSRDLFNKTIIINNQIYSIMFNRDYKSYRPVYKIEIVFSINSLNSKKYYHNDIFLEEKKLPTRCFIRYISSNQGFIIYGFTYKHPILLTWEEITDKRYLDFVMASVSESLTEHIEQNYKGFYKMGKFNKGISHINIFVPTLKYYNYE